MIITDLDGTLLRDDKTVSEDDYRTLLRFGEQSVLRVVATGRNLYSVSKVLPDTFPIDYLVFSTGAGIVEWKTKRIIERYHLGARKISAVFRFLRKNGYDFMIHEPIPDNHHFFYYKGTKDNPDFFRRIEHYKDFGKEGDDGKAPLQKACQFLIIEPGTTALDRYHDLKRNLRDVKIIRATSPLDKRSLWIEIYSNRVSKAHAGAYIAGIHSVPSEHVVAIGNDYNDVDMLRWAGTKLVVSNAACELQREFPGVPGNNCSGFTHAVDEWHKRMGKRMNFF